MPKVSAVITSYNQMEYIFEAIESLVYQVDELIVVDDKSTDGSVEKIIEQYSKIPNFSLLKNQNNLGVAASFNTGFHAASGDYIIMQGGDDVSLPNRRQIQETTLNENKDVLLTFSEPTIIDEKGLIFTNSYAENSFKNPIGKSNYTARLFLEGNSVCAPSVAFRRKELLEVGGFLANFDHIQDYLAWLFLSIHGDFYYSDIPTVKFRIHGQNISRKIEDSKNPIVKARNAEFAIAINMFVDSLNAQQVEDIFEKLNMNFNHEYTLELSKIQLKRKYCNSVLKLFALEDSYKLSSAVNSNEREILKQLIRQLPSEISY